MVLLGGDVGGVAVVGENQVDVGVVLVYGTRADDLTPCFGDDTGEALPLVLMRLGFVCRLFAFVRLGTRTEGSWCMKP